MIEVKGISKQYGSKIALDNVSFSVKKGEIIGLLGRNGAGKTTTMNIITGYLSSDAGEVRIGDYDILEQPEKAKRSIGYLPEHPPVYPEMTVYSYLVFACKLMRVPKKEIPSHLEEILNRVNIMDVKDRLIGNLSKGYQQRVGLAKALCGNPDIIILDEPTVGLDPNQIVEIRKTIKELGKTHTVILSSHILNEISDICTSVIILSRGKLVAASSLKDLLKGVEDEKQTVLRVVGNKDLTAVLNGIPQVIKVKRLGELEAGSTDYLISSKEDVRSKASAVAFNSGCGVLMQKSTERTLEEIFLELTQESEAGIAI